MAARMDSFISIKELTVTLPVLLFLTSLLTFVNTQVFFETQEEQVPPVLIGNVGDAQNIANMPNLRYTIIGNINYQQDLFELDAQTGDLKTKEILDREELCGTVPKCVLVTSVAASSPPDFLTRFNVNVTVVDANDQSPEFRETEFTIAMSEQTQINSTFQLPAAFDTDVEPLFKVRGYRLQPEFQTMFDLVEQPPRPGTLEPTVQLRLRRKLDREYRASHSVNLVAYDGGSSAHTADLPITITVLDENDNSPEFSALPYTKTVKEIEEIGRTVFAVTATDMDEGDNGRVGFEFSLDTDRRTREFFKVEEASGNIKLIKSLVTEGGKSFVFKVNAFDYGSPSRSSEAEITIFIEDTMNDPPTIQVSPWNSREDNALVSESDIKGTKVAFVDVEDSDSGNNGVTSCFANNDFFILKPYTKAGVYTISIDKELDRESDATHSIVITCSDNGNPPQTSTANLTIIVEDANDNPPVFNRKIYKMKVKENQEAGRYVGTVSASDIDEGENAEIRFALEDDINEFNIDPKSGEIKTAVNNLDRETKSFYSFLIYAINDGDTPITATASLVVNIEDINDVWPRFDNASYRFSVSEYEQINKQIGSVHAHDPDLNLGGIVEYIMIHSPLNQDPPFSVSRDTGSIILTEALDHEKKNSYHFVVTAVDMGRPPKNSSVEVTIDVVDENDNSPVITFPSPDNLSVTLNLDVSPGHEVVRVIASDADSEENGRLSYSLSSGNSTSRLFWINEDNGLITLKSHLQVSDIRKYELVISVHDNSNEQRATRAILQVEVVRSLQRPHSGSDSNMTIVIIMVCVTLFVAIIVLATLCFIRHLDKKKFDTDKRNQKTSTTAKGNYSSAAGGQVVSDMYFDTSVEITPSLQKQPMASATGRTSSLQKLNSKKSVTFDEDAHTSMSSDATNPLNDSVFLESGMSTFKPNPPPLLYTQNGTLVPATSSTTTTKCTAPGVFVNKSNSKPFSNTDVSPKQAMDTSRNSISPLSQLSSPRHNTSNNSSRMCSNSKSDSVINNALQQHNALVRSIRGNHHRPSHSNRQVKISFITLYYSKYL